MSDQYLMIDYFQINALFFNRNQTAEIAVKKILCGNVSCDCIDLIKMTAI